MDKSEIENHIELVYPIFVEWRAKPARLDEPKSITEFCEKYNISQSDIANYVKRPEFTDDLRTQTMIWARSKLPEIFHIAYTEVKKSRHIGDIEKFVNLIEDLRKKDRDVQNVQYNFFNTLPENVYEQIIHREAKSLAPSSTETID